MKLKEYTDEELRFGIERCRAKIKGTMPLNISRKIMTDEKLKSALEDYQKELDRRNVKYLDFA